jgi:putative glutathione S-transferase
MASLVTPVVCLSGTFSGSESGRFRLKVATQRKRVRARVSCEMEDGSSGWGKAPADWVKLVGQKVWGRSLPPGALVAVVKEVWTAGWHTMMAQLAPPTETKDYNRPSSQFRNRPQSSPPPRLGQFHLYVALACPWAHRAAIVHSLKGLHDAVPISVAVPGATGLWEFSPRPPQTLDRLTPTPDRANNQNRLRDVYTSQPGSYNGRSTVPMLWDNLQKRVVNNESADIIETLNSDFNHLARHPDLDLAPAHLLPQIASWNDLIYSTINNGVYKCGFAQSQPAYDSAVDSLFTALDKLEAHLATSRYLCGETFTLADVRLFTTLFRFDPVYQILFKCSKQKLAEFPNLHDYMRDVYQIPGVASTCDLEAIMHGYYKVLFPLNPGGISPAMPRVADSQALLEPHNRQNLSSQVVVQ